MLHVSLILCFDSWISVSLNAWSCVTRFAFLCLDSLSSSFWCGGQRLSQLLDRVLLIEVAVDEHFGVC